MDIIQQLKGRSSELIDLYHIMALLHWDQETQMPELAGEARANQLATLSGIIHRKEVDPELGDLIAKAEDQSDTLSAIDRGLVRVMRRSYDQQTKLPEEFVAEFSRLTSQAFQTWVKARRQDDFALFQPLLEKVIDSCRRKAEYLGYAHEPYDALLDLHEEGLVAKAVEEMFTNLRGPLQELVTAAETSGQSEMTFDPPFEQVDQERFSEQLLTMIGFDFNRGLQARSPHPFSTSLGHHDRRLTNRYNPKSCEFIFAALHEGGHAMYEQGIDESLSQTHLDTGISLGIHESQSRLWENIIGRSPSFWQYLYPHLQLAFPAQFEKMPEDQFLRGINAVRPGLIRVEADEVTYNLHVLIRFELELALIRGELAVRDLPSAWNAKYREYLGVTVDSNANGVLQDVHWPHGSFGYFPTYTIGNLAAAQIWAAYSKDDPQAVQTLQEGNFTKIRQWLTDKIYRHGSVYQPDTLLKMVTGEGLNSGHFVRYLRKKYGEAAGA